MDVSYSDSITNTVKSLRESVYNTDEFKEEFVSALEKNICATDTEFVAEQFGGWSVNVTTDKNKVGVQQDSASYLGKISDALTTSIHNVNRFINYSKVSASNLANVIITGDNSITVKL